MSYKEELIMILKNQIITDIKIKSVNDLYKLKPFLEDGTLKINKSQIARELDVDRRTVDKYINGYTKPKNRNSNDCITPYYDKKDSSRNAKLNTLVYCKEYQALVLVVKEHQDIFDEIPVATIMGDVSDFSRFHQNQISVILE